MAYISKITPLGSSTSYDIRATALGSSTVGSSNTAIYLNNGTPTACYTPVSGNFFRGIPQVGSDGVMEIGKYIDFHSTNAATTDYDVRLTATTQLTSSATIEATGLLKTTNNSNTTTIGSQNANFCHIYNSVNIPFIFNNSVLTTGGNLGDSTYPFDNLTLGRSNGAGIYYKGTQNTYRMIRFIDNTSDVYGNGISIGGGGQTIIGGGESADTAAAQAGTVGGEIMQVCNDGDVQIISNLQDGWANRKVSTFNTTGNLTLPAKLVCANVGNTTGGSYTESGLEIREYNYGSDQSDTWGNAPRMTFHWGGRVQTQIGLASNGWLYTTSGYGGDLTTNPHRFVIESGGTWNIGISGNAATATTGKYLWTGSANPVYGTSRLEYFNSTGTAGTPQANATSYPTSDWYHFIRMNHGNSQGYYVEIASCFHDNNMYWRRTVAGTAYPWCHVWLQGNSVTGAVWNDYAEYREATPDSTTPGYVVFENGDDTLSLTTKRLQHFAGITSDTWGFAQGETEKAKTPIAVSGRVLAYTYRDRNEYKPGDCVCAAPGGTIDIMTREEIREWPDRIVGTVSCVPEYDEWGGGELADRPSVKVNGRIWIKVR